MRGGGRREEEDARGIITLSKDNKQQSESLFPRTCLSLNSFQFYAILKSQINIFCKNIGMEHENTE